MIQACGCSLRFLVRGLGSWWWRGGLLPEGDRRYSAHEGIGSDALQVEQDPVEEQQEDDVLAEAKAPPTLANDGDVLEVADQTNPTRRRQPSTNSPSGSCRLRPDVLHKSGYCYLHAKVHCDSQFYLPHSKVQESKEWHHMNSEAPLVAASSTNGPSTCLESVQQQGQLESEKG